jgi:hypothetical protein
MMHVIARNCCYRASTFDLDVVLTSISESERASRWRQYPQGIKF